MPDPEFVSSCAAVVPESVLDYVGTALESGRRRAPGHEDRHKVQLHLMPCETSKQLAAVRCPLRAVADGGGREEFNFNADENLPQPVSDAVGPGDCSAGVDSPRQHHRALVDANNYDLYFPFPAISQDGHRAPNSHTITTSPTDRRARTTPTIKVE